ncbi:MAG: hypothetical protein AAF533_18750 [Acidobacteriota bacterium]
MPTFSLRLLSCVFAVAMAANVSAEAVAVLHPAKLPALAGADLLVLELDRNGGLRLLDGRHHAGRVKTAASRTPTSGELGLAWLDAEGEPQLIAFSRVAWEVHGPTLFAEGQWRCQPHPLDEAVIAVKLPRPVTAHELVVFQLGETAPTSAAELRRALRARPQTAGLRVLARFPRTALATGDRP